MAKFAVGEEDIIVLTGGPNKPTADCEIMKIVNRPSGLWYYINVPVCKSPYKNGWWTAREYQLIKKRPPKQLDNKTTTWDKMEDLWVPEDLKVCL